MMIIMIIRIITITIIIIAISIISLMDAFSPRTSSRGLAFRVKALGIEV